MEQNTVLDITASDVKSWDDSRLRLEVEIFVSCETRKIFEIVNYVCLCGIISLLGIIGNIVNIIVFCKQGFSNTSNIAFFGLAVSDLCCLVALEGTSFCMNPLFLTFSSDWDQLQVMYLSTGLPHICFCRITSFITVYITAERYVSIASPLKVKQIITPRITIMTFCLIFLINILTFIPEYVSAYLDWTFVAKYNRIIFGLTFTSARQKYEGMSAVLHSIFSVSSFIGVVRFTVVLVTKLRQTSALRKELTSTHDKAGRIISNRDKKMVKMIVLIASVLIVCYIPGAVGTLMTVIYGREFSIKGRYINELSAVWSIIFVFQGVNSSINCVLYYTMSSKYRQTLHQTFLNLRGTVK